MSDSARVQRWREGKRQDGLKAITIAQFLVCRGSLLIRDRISRTLQGRSILLRKAMHALKFYI